MTVVGTVTAYGRLARCEMPRATTVATGPSIVTSCET